MFINYMPGKELTSKIQKLSNPQYHNKNNNNKSHPVALSKAQESGGKASSVVEWVNKVGSSETFSSMIHCKNIKLSWAMVALAFNPNTQEAEAEAEAGESL